MPSAWVTRSAVITLMCGLFFVADAMADAPKKINIPAGALVPALEALAKQIPLELVYRPDQLKELHTRGVSGTYTPQDAVKLLIEGAPVDLRIDASGAMAIVPQATTPPSAAPANDSTSTSNTEGGQDGTSWKRFRLAQGTSGQGSSALSKQDTGPSTAGDQKVALQGVTVTARRIQENIQSVPLAITALSGEQLRGMGIVRPADLGNVAPGLTVFPSVRGDSTPNYTIRGQRGQFNPTSMADPAVCLYFADLILARTGGTNGSLFDVESVQVLRGPQGSLFGRNCTGGAVLFTPNAPSHEFGGYVRVSGGNFDYFDQEGVLNVPLGDKAALRLGGKYSNRQGYLSNALTGQKINDLGHPQVYRTSLLLSPTDNVQSTFAGTYFEQTGAGFGNKLQSVDPRGTAFAFGPTLGALAASALRDDLAQQQALGRYEFRDVNRFALLDKAWSIQNNTQVDLGKHEMFGNLALKNILGFRRSKTKVTEDFSGSAVDMLFNAPSASTDDLSEELQLHGETGKFAYTIGAYYFHERGHEKQLSRLFGSLNAFDWVYPLFVYYEDDLRTSSYAAYLHVNYDLASWVKDLSISVGARMTHDKKEILYRYLHYDNVGTAYECMLLNESFPTRDLDACSFTPPKLSYAELTYDVSLNYQAASDLLLYLAHRRGYRAGGFNQVPVTDVIRISYDPEFVDDVELGAKFEFNAGDMAGRLNVAAYYEWYKDIQRTIGVLTPSGSLIAATVNAAKARIYGTEIELELKPSNLFEARLSYALTRPKYDRWVDNYSPAAGVSRDVDISDSDFQFVPKHQWTVSGVFSPLASDTYGDLSFTAALNGFSSMAAADVTTSNCGADGLYPQCLNRNYVIPGYSLLNLRVDWTRVFGNRFDLSAFVNNVTDKYYVNYALDQLGTLGLNSIGIGAPRMYGVSITANFGAE